jgi:bacteriocin resistance YdeI/OmpD-like protein/uncharacterized protein DUF1905
MKSKSYTTTLVRDGSLCIVPVPFDPVPLFGKVRASVKVTLNGYTYRSTIAAMGGPLCIPLRKSNREAAGLEGTERLTVRLELDTDERVVTPPADFVKALKAAPPAWERWRELSYSHQREFAKWVAGAKAAETRARRIQRAVQDISRRPQKRTRKVAG